MLPMFIGTIINGTTFTEEISTAKSSDVTPLQRHDLHFLYIHLSYKFKFRIYIHINRSISISIKKFCMYSMLKENLFDYLIDGSIKIYYVISFLYFQSYIILVFVSLYH